MSAFQNRNTRKPYTRPTNTDGQWLHDKAPGLPGVKRVPATFATPNSKIVVSNLHYEITPKDLASIFGQFGTLVREPLLRYDRSGRSTGTAFISFETPEEATIAKKTFDGKDAKGQAMSITFDTLPPRNPRRATSAPTTSTLLSRIQKPPLLDRLGVDEPNPKESGSGPVRSKRARKAAAKGPKKPKTTEDLDKELDAFMGDAEPAAAPAKETPAQDVEMA
ncbi:uncharacterized protein BT62DRAFT_918297 [Guyanagaster necrorhizus]|uniref:RRM domain-containing protein n=1 Tax=Guyanagaster necrorhizus TaxID=856835 RepID=A0A9P7VWV1_9AGAR|nr:uncharacterized protein BT62DRAFT_918297 [Guyanagaster necrorhizus MCA 3950]KAG7448753.1 hypothetical protein BT62DRAFT_918297 [Guyanagaster necrorhizus MCA 3950]